MYGLKALQADGLVAQRQEVKPAVQMRNSVDTYYRNVLPTAKTSSYTFNRFRSQPLLRAKPMVELAPKRMGSTYFNTFMAVPWHQCQTCMCLSCKEFSCVQKSFLLTSLYLSLAK